MKKITAEIDDVLQSTRELSALVTKEKSKGMRSRLNFEYIASISEDFITHRPPIEPTYDNVVARGKLTYPVFPAIQTLKNSYRVILAIWRAAYHEIVHITAKSFMATMMSETTAPMKGADSGVKIQMLTDRIRRLERELDSLRNVITQSKAVAKNGNVPSTSSTRSPVIDIIGVAPIRKWLTELNSADSLLKEDTAGLRLTSASREGRLVMDIKVLKALRAL